MERLCVSLLHFHPHTYLDTHKADEHNLKLEHYIAETSTKRVKEGINWPMCDILIE